MTMRAPKTSATGSSGQSAVRSQFERLGWGATPNPEHDLGTDLWLDVRDPRRFAIGALIGAQVKSGPSQFEEPKTDGGSVEGWWFRSDADHFKYWLTHQVPHIVVLHSSESGKSYWARIERDSIVSTGKDAKLLVASQNVLNEEALSDLLEFATAGAPRPQWEGSVWKNDNILEPATRLRCALLTPRLIAPHPNRGQPEVNAIEAIAMVTQCRFHDLNHASLTDQNGADEALWTLYRGYRLWVEGGDRSELIATVSTDFATLPPVAAAILTASALAESGDYKSALRMVGGAISREGADPVEHAWLQAHRARFLGELGDFDEAQRSALEVQRIRYDTSDATAMVLVAASTARIFTAGGYASRDIAGLIQDRDTAAAWWGSQTVAQGLSYRFDREFKKWAHDQTVTVATEDVVFSKLRSAMLVSGLAADDGAWKYAASLLARSQLMAQPEDTATVLALNLLRLANGGDEIKLAVAQILRVGPVEALLAIGAAVDLRQSTTSSIRSDLLFIRTGQDAFTDSDRARHLVDLTDLLEQIEEAQERFRPSFDLETFALEAIAALATTAGVQAQQMIRNVLTRLPPITDQARAVGYAAVYRRLDPDLWTASDITKVRARLGDQSELSVAIDRIVGHHVPGHRASLIERVRSGDNSALHSFGDITDLPTDAARDAIERFGEKVEHEKQEARNGRYAYGGYNQLGALTLLCLFHPDVARWEIVVAALAAPELRGDQLYESIWYVGTHPSLIPAEVAEQLDPILTQRAQLNPEPHAFFKDRDIRGVAQRAVAFLRPDTVPVDHLLQLFGGEAAERTAAVQILIARESLTDITLLALLARDSDQEVRLAVAEGLALWVAKRIADEECLAVLETLLNEPGLHHLQRVSGVLTRRNLDDHGRQLVAQLLCNKPSAVARSRARAVLTPSQ